jgi:SOS-response transcriptional repressor LexA
MNQDLTDRQREVLDFVRDFIAQHEFGPTVRDCMHGLNIRSPNGIVCHLKSLQRKGYIDRSGGKARGLRLLGGESIIDKMRALLRRLDPLEMMRVWPECPWCHSVSKHAHDCEFAKLAYPPKPETATLPPKEVPLPVGG